MMAPQPGLVLFCILSGLCGIVIFARYADCDPFAAKMITAGDQVLPLYVMDELLTYTGLPGLFISCVFCGSLSTISSGLNSMAAVVLQDIIRIYIGEFHDQADAKWIVIRGPLRGHNDTSSERPTPGRPIGHPEVGCP
jgi:sodium-dependent multivitamin transporter 6